MADPLGLDDEQTSVYRALVSTPSADVVELAESTRMPPEQVARVLDALEAQGLAARRVAMPDQFVASPPSLALGPRLVEQQGHLARSQELLDRLGDLYHESAARRGTPDVVDVVVGADALRQRVAQVQSGAAERVDVFIRSDVAVVPAAENTAEDDALRRGVRYRVIVEPPVLERPGFIEQARITAAAGEEVRVAPALPTRLIVSDGKLALLPMFSQAAEGVPGGLLVRPSGLLDLINETFESTWRRSPGVIDDSSLTVAADERIDRALISLLLHGLTDVAAADQLGVSARTVQRRVADMMEIAGVHTRMQLAAAAVRRGWVDGR